MVTIRNQTTRAATVLTLAERFADLCSAQAHLTRTTRINLHKHASSLFRFVREHKEKVRPSSVVDGLCKHAAGETLNIKVFDRYQSVVVRDLPRFCVMKISALISNVVVESCEQQHGLSSTVRVPLTARNASLQASELCLCRAEPTRVFDLSSVAQRCEVVNADVNTDHAGIERQRIRFVFDGEQSKPTTGLVLDGEAFDRTFKLSMQPDTHVANLRQSQAFPDQPMSGSAVCDAVIAAHGAKPWISSLLSSLYPSKESRECQVNTFQRFLQNVRVNSRHVIADLLNLCQLTILIEPGDRLSLKSPRVTAFPQRGVVQLAAKGKLFIQDLCLALCGINPIAERFDQGGLILTEGFSVA